MTYQCLTLSSICIILLISSLALLLVSARTDLDMLKENLRSTLSKRDENALKMADIYYERIQKYTSSLISAKALSLSFSISTFLKKKKLFTLWYMNRQQLFTVALSSYRSTSRVFSSFVYVSIANSCLPHIYGLRHDNTRHENTERVFFCTESYGIRVQLYRVNQKSM